MFFKYLFVIFEEINPRSDQVEDMDEGDSKCSGADDQLSP